MLVDVGCTHVILGHSERRHGLGETNDEVNKKLKSALEAKLIPIVCIGETKEERLAEQTEAVIQGQLAGSLAGLSPEQMAGTVLAYEPVWAIGTGLTATREQAQAVHAFIRDWLTQTFGEATAARVVVQYGGSVKPDNAQELLASPDIDGGAGGRRQPESHRFPGHHQGRTGSHRPRQALIGWRNDAIDGVGQAFQPDKSAASGWKA